ncbi:amino acid ABC transporter permease [Paraburkholderia bryophila]|uniref:amino acid ABC transporter permease n=1 Tax=Paraburkholderia bryophila TaxID=420952 RepID=UPI00234957FA|nr:amino acid ABC transporter permease [Paraburkholderia bryophila]WCM21781.1 amino acid ABC transporter permease [Paraburkholderia bryophila]
MIGILTQYWQTFLVGQYPHGSLGGVTMTLLIAVLCLAASFPIALLIAVCRTSRFGVLRWPAFGIVQFVRGMPLLMLIFWAYFLLPALTHVTVSGIVTLICALIIYQAAYLSEVIRSGIEAIPRGQFEAARALGLGYVTALQRVIVPQALYNVLPSMLSEFISTIKETSLGYVIGVQELTFAANQVNSQLLTRPLQVYLLLAATYFVICFALTRTVRYLEVRLNRRRTTRAAPVQTPVLLTIAGE